jgi:hypothetical protein
LGVAVLRAVVPNVYRSKLIILPRMDTEIHGKINLKNHLLYENLTFKIIGAAKEVYRVLGPGYLESVYEDALCYELELLKFHTKGN